MRRMFRKWLKKERGVVAVEFGLIALPLFTLLIGIIETSMFFTSGVVLEGASADAARMIRTGQVQLSADPETVFRTELCDKAEPMLDCDKIQYEVIHIGDNSFGSAGDNAPQFDADGNLIPQGFATGNSNDVVMIRTVYRYEFLTPFLGEMMTGDPSKNWMNHMSTVVLKAEPYQFGEE